MLIARQTVAAVTIIKLRLSDPITYRLAGRLELVGELLRAPAGKHERDELRFEFRRIRLAMSLRQSGPLSPSLGKCPRNRINIITGAVGRFGTSALAGYGIASRLDYLLIPLLFGLGTSVLTLVATNVGAGNLARARRIGWTGTAVGAGFTEIIGVAAAVFPAVWLGAFSRDHAVIAAGAAYLRIVAPLYFAVGITFVLSFASQGAGRPLWPFLGGTARLLLAAGLGWFAVSRGASETVLFAIVAASSLVSAALASTATLAGATMRPGRE